MTSWSLGIPYPPAGTGYWSPVTSTINWCEEVCYLDALRKTYLMLLLNCVQDYYATTYAAEIINTLTNLFFIGLAFKGVFNCIKHGHDTIFTISYVGFGIVGLGSLLFHATLKCRRYMPLVAIYD